MMIPQIHDHLFRNVFGDRREAAALLRPHLPAPLADALNWSTVTLLNCSYIDDDARASELDLLFTIERNSDQALLALMAAYRQGREQLQLALRVVRLLAALPRTGRFDIVKLFVTYLLQTQEAAHLARLSEEWRRRAPEAGGDFVTIAEMLIKQGRQEGHQEGRQEGRLETLEQMLRSGVEWPLVESAAGNDPDTLRALKERLATERTNGHADGAEQPEPPR